MKKYSKGTTMVEIMVSVVLISIVMIFIFTILVDLKNEYALASKKSKDSISRAGFMRIIQNDFSKYTLKAFNPCPSTTFRNAKICMAFTFGDPISGNNLFTKYFAVIVNTTNSDLNDYIIYDDSNSSSFERWDLEDGKYNADRISLCYDQPGSTDGSLTSVEKNNLYHFFRLVVPAYSNTSSNRKYDIEIVHVGKGSVDFNSTDIDNKLHLQTNRCD